MRRFEKAPGEPELSSRYTIDEARFPGGHERTRNAQEEYKL